LKAQKKFSISGNIVLTTKPIKGFICRFNAQSGLEDPISV
jgi:hypothetical protein